MKAGRQVVGDGPYSLITMALSSGSTATGGRRLCQVYLEEEKDTPRPNRERNNLVRYRRSHQGNPRPPRKAAEKLVLRTAERNAPAEERPSRWRRSLARHR